jgi:glyoxylase I family protein
MRVRGLTFVGTATDKRAEMVALAESVLGLRRVEVEGVEADMFELPNGVLFAVADERGMGDTSRSVGFLVEDVEEALAELRAVGIEPEDELARNARHRYVHVRLPDGHLYELIDERI